MMTRAAHVLNGNEVAAKWLKSVTHDIEKRREAGVSLALATVRVGHSKDAELYAASIDRLLAKVGVHHIPSVSPEKITEDDLTAKILALDEDPTVSGILVFSPLPAHIRQAAALNAVSLEKDVEGRRAFTGFGDRIVSPTANAVLALLEETGEEIAGKEAVVIGHSDVVGKPVSILLLDKMATVTVCHVKTRDLRAHVEKADIVVAAAGKPHLVKGAWIKPGALVIDVGENIVAGKLVGDVEFDAARERAAHISPVPGGVGPVTNVMLIRNLLKLDRLRNGLNGNH